MHTWASLRSVPSPPLSHLVFHDHVGRGLAGRRLVRAWGLRAACRRRSMRILQPRESTAS